MYSFQGRRAAIRLISLVPLATLMLACNLWEHTALVEEPTDGQAPKPKTVDAKTIRQLIAQLSDDSFDKREAAHKRLAEIGMPALELLTKAAKETADAEVRAHAVSLLQQIQQTGLHVARVEFYHDFRKKGVPRATFDVSGPAHDKRVKSEPEGLRITLAGEKGIPTSVVGVAPQFRVRGDFEVTVGYELLSAEKPDAGFGVGVEVYLMTETPTKEAIAFDRRILPDGRDVYACNHNTSDPKGRRLYATLEQKPASGKTGQIRMTRVGSKVAISVQDDIGKGFRVVHRVNLGPEELALLRVGANSGAAPFPVDVRIHDLRVRAADADALKKIAEVKPAPVQ
jgi:hypothetical protein